MSGERSADDLWLDAMEARQTGETLAFNLLREKTLEADPEHPDALMSEVRELFSQTGPRGDKPSKMSLAEAAIGLAIIVVYFRNSGTIRVEEIDKLKG